MPRGVGTKRRKTASNDDIVLVAQGKGWEGYGNDADTWEPIEHLAGHAQEIAAFRKAQEEKNAELAKASSAHRKRKSGASRVSTENSEQDACAADDDSGDSWKEGKGGKRKAACWDFYKVKLEPGSTDKVVAVCCKVCGPDSSPTWSGNTSNLRSHLAHIHKDLYCQMVEAEGSESAEVTQSTPKSGTLEAMLPPVSAGKRDVLHKKFALWVVRNKRPLSIGETDSELRDTFDYIFGGSYVPPTYELVTQNILKLSVEGKNKVQSALKGLLAEGILPSIAGDIWSEGGIAIFGILVYWVDNDGVYHQKLLGAIPFSEVRHTGGEIERATKRCAAEMGVGLFVEDSEVSDWGSSDDLPAVLEDNVAEHIHTTTSDSASNIVSGGAEGECGGGGG
ncbi:hypothetical protein CYMTET_33037 [Cymbomonas tetramitiformis]|uniref:BED-type domain-containing protein n=1 Tax=Cymbomonas tetramitiformis TaxID=36881 RepID=A0AAE0FDV4_9CHLO|nr:hypothetical protein CYMTET_33037 [Cymbomonas tetramitiformis]